MHSNFGMKIWIAITVGAVIAFTIILVVALLEPKPYDSQRTRAGEREITVPLVASNFSGIV
jgi:hypothetical protein